MRNYLLTMAVLMLAGIVNINAQTYTQDFDDDTSLPEGWEVVGGDFYTFDTGSTYYMNTDRDYSKSRPNSICCASSATTQWLATPKVTGQVSFQTRAYRSNRACSIKVYRVSDDGTTLGSEITSAARSWAKGKTAAYEQVSFNLGAEGTRLAFVCNFAYIDDFAADLFVEGAEVRGLSVMSVTSAMEGTELTANSDNELTLKFDVEVKNSGNVDLTTADEGFSLTLLNPQSGEVFKEQSLTATLAAGATTTIRIEETITVSETIEGEGRLFAVRENVTETQAVCASQFTITAVRPKFALYDVNPTTTYATPLTGANIINFGNIAEPLSGTYYLRNEGNAPLVVSSITCPDGFTVSENTLTLTAGEMKAITITLTPEAGKYGSKSGDIKFTCQTVADFKLSVKGITRDPNALYLTFADEKIPEGWNVGKGWRIGQEGYLNPNYNIEQYDYDSTSPTRLITTQVTVGEDDELSFRAKRYSSDFACALTVTYSADGQNWMEAEELTDDLIEDFQDFSIDGIPAGTWYIGFLGMNVNIDDIVGYTLAQDAPLMAVYDSDPATGNATAVTSGTEVHFGAVSKNTERTFYVKNIGTGTLNVSVSSTSQMFIATPATFALAQGETKAVKITFIATTLYGPNTGTVTIQPANQADVSLALDANLLDPSKLYADFEDQQLPEGWKAGATWSIEQLTMTSNCCVVSKGDGDSTLVSPMVSVKEGDVLLFEARNYGITSWYPPLLSVAYSADGASWTEAQVFTDELTSDFTAFHVNNIPAGNWYVAFCGVNVYIDNVSGLTLAAEGAIGGPDNQEPTGQDIPSAIHAAQRASAQTPCYLLNGQRVQNVGKPGLYIRGGKKYLVR